MLDIDNRYCICMHTGRKKYEFLNCKTVFVTGSVSASVFSFFFWLINCFELWTADERGVWAGSWR